MKKKNFNQYNVFFAVNTSEQLKEIKKLCCTIFGGYSLQDMQGGWTSPSGEVVEEDSKFLQILTNKDERHIENLCEHITKIADQQEVFYICSAVSLNVVKQSK